MSKTKRIHINLHNLRHNRKTGERKPVITCKSYDENQLGNRVSILDSDGNEVAAVVYTPDNPLNCGATVYVETKLAVEVTT